MNSGRENRTGKEKNLMNSKQQFIATSIVVLAVTVFTGIGIRYGINRFLPVSVSQEAPSEENLSVGKETGTVGEEPEPVPDAAEAAIQKTERRFADEEVVVGYDWDDQLVKAVGLESGKTQAYGVQTDHFKYSYGYSTDLNGNDLPLERFDNKYKSYNDVEGYLSPDQSNLFYLEYGEEGKMQIIAAGADISQNQIVFETSGSWHPREGDIRLSDWAVLSNHEVLCLETSPEGAGLYLADIDGSSICLVQTAQKEAIPMLAAAGDGGRAVWWQKNDKDTYDLFGLNTEVSRQPVLLDTEVEFYSKPFWDMAYFDKEIVGGPEHADVMYYKQYFDIKDLSDIVYQKNGIIYRIHEFGEPEIIGESEYILYMDENVIVGDKSVFYNGHEYPVNMDEAQLRDFWGGSEDIHPEYYIVGVDPGEGLVYTCYSYFDPYERRMENQFMVSSFRPEKLGNQKGGILMGSSDFLPGNLIFTMENGFVQIVDVYGDGWTYMFDCRNRDEEDLYVDLVPDWDGFHDWDEADGPIYCFADGGCLTSEDGKIWIASGFGKDAGKTEAEMSVNNYLYSNSLRDRLLIYNESGWGILSKKNGEYDDAVLDEDFSLLHTHYEKKPGSENLNCVFLP